LLPEKRSEQRNGVNDGQLSFKIIKHAGALFSTSAQGFTLMYNFSKWGKHFSKLITTSKQSFTSDKDITFTLSTTFIMLKTADP
jgi:spore cortex formation protein SpoVR/YcgB (stage V sporulation)